MGVIFKKKKDVVASASINVKPGSFALESTPLRFETCRERFAKQFNENKKEFFFKHSPDKGIEVATFVNKIEDLLSLDEKSKFSETNRNTILWVECSTFWSQCPMRRSLFTILLRAGMLYETKKDNFEESLFSEKYVKRTKRAVMRFLFGFTEYSGTSIVSNSGVIPYNTGWVTVFEKKDDDFLISNLVTTDNFCKKLFVNQLSERLWM
jgi:hypothetical protein